MKRLTIKNVKKLFLVLLLMGLTLIGFNNCGRFTAVSEDSGQFSSFSSSTEDLDLPFALLSAEQTLSSMLKVTDQAAVTPQVTTEYMSRYAALAAGNNLSMVNSPLMLGTTSLAGEVCNGLITKEKAITPLSNRSYFESIDFTKAAENISTDAYAVTVRRMARSFWGRNENNSELLLFQQYKLDFETSLSATEKTQAASSSNLLMSTCSAMLSSFDAITY